MSKKELFELLDCLASAMTLVDKYQKLINPLLDPYFRGLSSSDIAELAKKSIRLTAENRRLEEALEEIEKVCLEDTCTFADGTQIRYDSLDDILDIINKAKGEGKCQ